MSACRFSAVFTGMAVFCGQDSIRRQLDEFWETWEGVRMEPLEVFDIGGGQFVVDLRFWGKGRRSGVEIEAAMDCARGSGSPAASD